MKKTVEFPVPAEEWIDIKIEILGQQLTLWINGIEMFHFRTAQDVGSVSLGMKTWIHSSSELEPLVVISDELELVLVPYTQAEFDIQTLKIQAAMLQAMQQPKPLECFDFGETERVVEEVAEPTPSHIWQ